MATIEKKVYWILSGEGECGTWERKVSTEGGIKSILTRERCGGDRWAHAYGDCYETKDGSLAGYDVETGEQRFITH
mgnify:CR=1 FL=1